MTSFRITPLLIAAAILALSGAAEASAAKTVPPDDSGIGQYEETIPGGGGDRSPNGKGPAKPSADPVLLATLTSFGADGADAASLARIATDGEPRATKRGSGRAEVEPGEDSGTGSALAGTLLGTGAVGGGSGPLLPLLLLAITVFALAGRFRGGRAGDS